MITQLKLKLISSLLALCIAGVGSGCTNAAIETAEDPDQLYEKGEFTRAVEIWDLRAKSGDPSAQFNLSTAYQSGRGVDPDPAVSLHWLEASAKNNYAPALHNLALVEIENNQFGNALTLLERAASQDFIASLYTLGKFHQEGIMGKAEPELAVLYVTKAAKSGLDKAQYNLGKMYRDGFGVDQSDERSFFWFLKAAEQGRHKAQIKVARRYAQGVGVSKNTVRALAWIYVSETTGKEKLFDLKEKLLKTLTEAEIGSAKSQALQFEKEMSQ